MPCTVICFYFVCINSRQEKFTLKYIRTLAMCSIVTRTNKTFGLNNFRTRGLVRKFFNNEKQANYGIRPSDKHTVDGRSGIYHTVSIDSVDSMQLCILMIWRN